MTMPSSDAEPEQGSRCEYLLLIATSSEEEQLKEVARGMGLKLQRKRLADRGSYYELGRLGGASSSRVNAIRVDMGAHGYAGSASKAIFFRGVFGAQAIICLGMAFGVDPVEQKAGDVLVSVGLLPYDDRIVRCEDGGRHRYEYERTRMYPSKESLVRLFERHRDELKEQQHAVHFGLMLSGSLRVQCASYRDELVKDAAAAAGKNESGVLPPIIGGEMEGVGLLSTSSPQNPIWIIVKGISDFADGKAPETFSERRTRACANSVEFVLKALARDEVSLEGHHERS